MTSFKLVALLSLIIAGLCVVLILPWALGVPGQIETGQNRYADGWILGLLVISLYPISILLIYGFNLIVWILFLYSKIGKVGLMRCQHISTLVAISILAIAIIQIIRAFRIMFGN